MTAIATVTAHACGTGDLLFVRESSGHSYERCAGGTTTSTMGGSLTPPGARLLAVPA